MVDAIKIQGTYLKAVKRASSTAIQGQYVHSIRVQSAMKSNASLPIPWKHFNGVNRSSAIRSVDKPEYSIKVFKIIFDKQILLEISESAAFGKNLAAHHVMNGREGETS